MAGTLLQLKALGIDNFLSFEWLAPPPSEMVVRALEVGGSGTVSRTRGTLPRPCLHCRFPPRRVPTERLRPQCFLLCGGHTASLSALPCPLDLDELGPKQSGAVRLSPLPCASVLFTTRSMRVRCAFTPVRCAVMRVRMRRSTEAVD